MTYSDPDLHRQTSVRTAVYVSEHVRSDSVPRRHANFDPRSKRICGGQNSIANNLPLGSCNVNYESIIFQSNRTNTPGHNSIFQALQRCGNSSAAADKPLRTAVSVHLHNRTCTEQSSELKLFSGTSADSRNDSYSRSL